MNVYKLTFKYRNSEKYTFDRYTLADDYHQAKDNFHTFNDDGEYELVAINQCAMI